MISHLHRHPSHSFEIKVNEYFDRWGASDAVD